MSLQVRTGTAFRRTPTATRGDEVDVVRVLDDGGAQLALIANGFECGFSACWPRTSRLIQDLLLEARGETADPIGERSTNSFGRSRERVAARASPLVSPRAEVPDDRLDAVLPP